MRSITADQLKRMTPEARATLYENARGRRSEGGQEIMDLIDSLGLPLRSGGMRLTDPVYLQMEEIIWSERGRAAALAATEKGLPALAGVEPFFSRRWGIGTSPTTWEPSVQDR